MSNQPTNIATKFAALGTNARVLTGFVALAVGVLATGTAATLAGGNDTTVASHADAPATTDQSAHTSEAQAAPLTTSPSPMPPTTAAQPTSGSTADTTAPAGNAASTADPSTTAAPNTAAPDAATPTTSSDTSPDTTQPPTNQPPTNQEPAGPTAPDDEVDEPDVEGKPGESTPGPGGSDWTPDADTNPGGGDVPLDPTTNEVDPCTTIADPQQLFVLPVVTQLDSGAFSGHITVLNCSPAPLPVELAAASGMTFDQKDTVLPLGTSTHTFSIDQDRFEVGAFDFKYKLTQVGCCADYANVHGFKQGFNPDYYNADLGLSAGAGAGGCNAGCITSAWIEGNQLNTSVELNVGTNSEAQIDAFVSTQAPVPNQVGDPAMPGLAPALSSGGATTALNGTLTGLSANTDYYLLVRAIDDNGTSTFVGEFTTVTPLEHPDQLGGNDLNPGCAAGCITHATVGDVSTHVANLTVATFMPATIEAWLSTSPIDESGQHPTAVDPTHHFNTPADWSNWELAMSDLDDDTTYHVLVRATDENGKRDHQIGNFTTLEAPPTPVRVSAERIVVNDSGDVIGRGEVRFGFSYDGVLVGSIGEQKLKDSATVHPSDHNFITTALRKDEALKTFATWAGERDVSIAKFCEAPVNGLACVGINWTGAYAGNLTLDQIAELPKCGPLGFDGDAADDHCEQVQGFEGIGDYVHFTTVIRYDVG